MSKTVNQICCYIRDNIREKNWTVGEKIPSENQLSRELGVSRMSIRSAFQRFIVLGILESKHGQGTFLKSDNVELLYFGEFPFDSNLISDAKNIQQCRLILEPTIVRMITNTATPELIESLLDINTQMKKAVGDIQLFIKLDAEFHRKIVYSLKNPVLNEFIDYLLSAQAVKEVNESLGYYGGVYFHTLIAEAISKHDATAAYHAMYKHISDTEFIE